MQVARAGYAKDATDAEDAKGMTQPPTYKLLYVA